MLRTVGGVLPYEVQAESDNGETVALKANNNTMTSDLDYADSLWKAADALRGQVDAAEYKHVVLGLLFLKYISDSFEIASRSAPRRAGQGRHQGQATGCSA